MVQSQIRYREETPISNRFGRWCGRCIRLLGVRSCTPVEVGEIEHYPSEPKAATWTSYTLQPLSVFGVLPAGQIASGYAASDKSRFVMFRKYVCTGIYKLLHIISCEAKTSISV